MMTIFKNRFFQALQFWRRVPRLPEVKCCHCGAEAEFVPCLLAGARRSHRGDVDHCLRFIFALPACQRCRDERALMGVAGVMGTERREVKAKLGEKRFKASTWGQFARQVERNGQAVPREEFSVVLWWKPPVRGWDIIIRILKLEAVEGDSRLYMIALEKLAMKLGAYG